MCIKVTIINFTVTQEGLEDQLLGLVVREERPDLERQKNQLIKSLAADKKTLKELEDKILKLLSESQGNILDDEVLINTLSDSKITSGVINTRVAEAEVTNEQINTTRLTYVPAAERGSIIYFTVADLAMIGDMYQFSLEYFSRSSSLHPELGEVDELEVRLANVMKYASFTSTTTCRAASSASTRSPSPSCSRRASCARRARSRPPSGRSSSSARASSTSRSCRPSPTASIRRSGS